MNASLLPRTTGGSAMDALLLRSLQGYVRDTFGPKVWQAICRRVGLKFETFEPMLRYDLGTADRVAQQAADALGRSVEAIWEDMGTYLVTNPVNEGVRRLLRFGGLGFADFLHSLEEMPGRARLAMPDLDLPEIDLQEIGPERFELRCRSRHKGMVRVLVGMLTAMADDYGTLCLIDPGEDGRISVRVLDSFHGQARPFDLALPER